MIQLAEISWEWVIPLVTGGAAGALASKYLAPKPEESATYLRAKERLERELQESEELVRKEYKELEHELKASNKEAERERRAAHQKRETTVNQHAERLDQREREPQSTR